MTSMLRVSDHKRGKYYRAKSGDGKPGEGTLIRQFYDDLRRGDVVTFGRQHRTIRNSLTDFYGMDIEAVRSETGANIGSRLIGEWDGPYYIPVERIVSSLMEPV